MSTKHPFIFYGSLLFIATVAGRPLLAYFWSSTALQIGALVVLASFGWRWRSLVTTALFFPLVVIWPRVVALVASTLGASRPAAAPASGAPPIVNCEGPPGAGKTYSLSRLPWPVLFGVPSVEFSHEDIPRAVMANYYANKAVVGFMFENYMAAVRLADERRCRAETGRVHVRDRTLIGSAIFHMANYVAGDLDEAEHTELGRLDLVTRGLAPVVGGGGGEWRVVVVYYGTPYSECLKRVVERDGADAAMPPRYLQIVCFCYAYAVAAAIADDRRVDFLLAERLGDAPAPLTPAAYAEHRVAVVDAAAANLEITLTDAEHARFVRVAPRASIDGYRWTGVGDGKRRYRPTRAIVGEQLAAVRDFGGRDTE